MLTVCSGSSIDQQSNNASLFNLVEQINVPAGAGVPPGGVVPLEIHAYWQLEPEEVGRDFWLRFVMLATSGLETSSNPHRHRVVSPRFRTRSVGLPYPPVIGGYSLRADWKFDDEEEWQRAAAAWPVRIHVVEQIADRVTH
ncbi:MAG: hypothetical protein RJA70_3301 [Pseudomonadota bacterium]|jgi:hypothetical protein